MRTRPCRPSAIHPRKPGAQFLNAVLAYMGAPVRCTKLRLSSFAIGAAARMQDSVVDGRSHFLAEMQRLRRMIEAADQAPLLFLVDEIMSGTNSHDRRIATEWVIRALMLRGAIGAITTHDLALTEIASNGLPGCNVCFEDAGEFGSLSFDYKLRPRSPDPLKCIEYRTSAADRHRGSGKVAGPQVIAREFSAQRLVKQSYRRCAVLVRHLMSGFSPLHRRKPSYNTPS
jgi:hypothetical protein